MKTDIPTNGSMVKNHISSKTGFGYLCNTENFIPIVVPGLSSSSSGSSSTSRTPLRQESHSSSSSSPSSPSPTVSEIQIREGEDATNSDMSPVPMSKSVDDRSGQPDETQANKIQKPNKKETMIERDNPLDSDIPEWLQEFRENLVDDEIPVHGGSHASSSHEASLEPTFKRREDLGKHSVYTHFPKDRNCEICKTIKIQGYHAEDAMAKPYLVLKNLVTSQETQRSLQKFLEPDRNPEVIYTDYSWQFGKACEGLSWNHCTSTPHRSETDGIAERAVRRVKEGTSSVLLQSGLNESWWADSMECYTYQLNVTDLLSDGKTPSERRFGQPLKDRLFHLVHWLSITL